jgi:hypothetical protein
LQVPLEQGHGPHGGRVAKVLRAAGQKLPEQVPLGFGEQGGPAGAAAVSQDSGVAGERVGGEPVVDGPRGHPEATGDGGDGLPGGDFEYGQGAAVHAGIVGGPQLLLQTPPLPVGQGQGVHRLYPLPLQATSICSGVK